VSDQKIRITVLVENTAHRRGLLAEHGLAYWIEAGDSRMLFDTGQGLALAHNANKLGIDLSTADAVLLSHGHYDHTGGLHAELGRFRNATVYAHLTAFRERFIRRDDGSAQPVGSPIPSVDELRPHVKQLIHPRRTPVQIADGVWMTGEIPRQNNFEDVGGAFYLDRSCTTPDPIIDDQAVYIETGQGVVVLLGCAHAGVVNTLDYIRSLTKEARIHAVLGGMHLLHADEHRLCETVRRLREFDVHRIGPAHCTGFAAMARLFHELPDRCYPCVAGTQFEFV
jgi:7,8-dihydropterin-6-yl-methyl-4-(beta-D-ribofuranosyl)aminobenzene 5'-phosphate synthase